MSKISKEMLGQIRQKAEDVSLKQAELGELQANLKMLVAKAISSVGKPIKSSQICMDCGVVRPLKDPRCVCSKEVPIPQNVRQMRKRKG
jgi:hypothetical protein